MAGTTGRVRYGRGPQGGVWNQENIFETWERYSTVLVVTATVAAVEYRQMACGAMSYHVSEFLVAESISKETLLFGPKRWNRFFLQFKSKD